jgi:hypothetical protein
MHQQRTEPRSRPSLDLNWIFLTRNARSSPLLYSSVPLFVAGCWWRSGRAQWACCCWVLCVVCCVIGVSRYVNVCECSIDILCFLQVINWKISVSYAAQSQVPRCTPARAGPPGGQFSCGGRFPPFKKKPSRGSPRIVVRKPRLVLAEFRATRRRATAKTRTGVLGFQAPFARAPAVCLGARVCSAHEPLASAHNNGMAECTWRGQPLFSPSREGVAC